MTLLITGLPRSGTSFLLQMMNEEWNNFNPKIYTNYHLIEPDADLLFNLNEPQILSQALRHGDHATPIMDKIKEHYSDCEGELLLKLPQMIACSADTLEMNFEKIIICFRQREGWEKSAIEHGIEGYLDERPEWLPDHVKTVAEIYSYFWARCHYMMQRLSRITVKYNFCDDQSLDSVMKFLGYNREGVKHSDFEYWRGSRHE